MSITGLHTCKPGNEPVVGAVKTFTVEQRTSESGKNWTKIKGASPDQGGQPYRIMSAKPTGRTDSYGNVSFNLELDAAPTPQPLGPRSAVPGNGGDRSSRIERQHSQEMALRYFAQRPEILKATESAEQAAKLIREMTSWFQRDISRSPEKQAQPEQEPELEPEMLEEPGDEPY